MSITIGNIEVSITLPIYARSEANNRDSRQKKAARAKEQRGTARMMLNIAAGFVRLANPEPLTINLTRIHKARNPDLDDDNLRTSLKAVRDGVADALGINDGDKQHTWTYGQETGPDFGVRIEIGNTR